MANNNNYIYIIIIIEPFYTATLENAKWLIVKM